VAEAGADFPQSYLAEEARLATQPTVEEVRAVAARHGPLTWEEQVSAEELTSAITNGTSRRVLVVAADIRRSTFLMNEAMNRALHARILGEWIAAVRGFLSHIEHGWFDKFTGDGFLAYWFLPTDDDGQTIHRRIADMLAFSERCLNTFHIAIEKIRRNSWNFPAGFGLALGIDVGEVVPSIIDRDLTLVGRPVVGAVRMLDAAPPGHAVVNIQIGAALEESVKGDFERAGIMLERRQVSTKEYPDGQDAYVLRFPPPAASAPTSPEGMQKR
jgi:class 3 adenylate cyclase